MLTATPNAVLLGTILNHEYQAGGNEATLRNVARAIRSTLPADERASFTDAVEMCGLMLSERHTEAAQRHYPSACRVAEQFGHALRMHRSYGAECIHCGAVFAESDAEAMDSAYVGDAEAREIAGSFAQDCPRVS